MHGLADYEASNSQNRLIPLTLTIGKSFAHTATTLSRIAEGEDKDLILWQVLLHVVNHGTDHRAQLLRWLNDLGVNTEYQDYIFYVYGYP